MIKKIVWLTSLSIIMFSCNNGKKEEKINKLKEQGTIPNSEINIYDTLPNKKVEIRVDKSKKNDSVYRLKFIHTAWTGEKLSPKNEEYIIFNEGKLDYKIDKSLIFSKKYILTKNKSYGTGKYLLNIGNAKFNSIDFYNDSVTVYQNAEDESYFTFEKEK